MAKTKTIFNWSGGKDSSLCLHRVLRSGKYEIACLLTTINEGHQRISMHGVRVELLQRQAESMQLPLTQMAMPPSPSMRSYDNRMAATLKDLKSNGATACIFGDIFLEDLRRYREERLAEAGLRGIFPLWMIPTQDLVREFIGLGFKAMVVCVNDRFLDKSFAGRIIDHDFLKDLPSGVDPCGEYGEFHSFVYDGPIFKEPVRIRTGEIVHRKYEPPQENEEDASYDCAAASDDALSDTGFWYCDLLPA